MKVAVIGSRLAEPGTLNMIIKAIPTGCSEIISGGANGVDFLAKRAANKLELKYTCVKPKYYKYGRSAPLVRNIAIIDKSDFVLAFWDGHSKGTQHAIGCCIKRRKPFRIFLINTHDVIAKNI